MTIKTARPIIVILLIGLIFAAANMRTPVVMIGSIVPILQEHLQLSTSQIGYLGALPMPLFALGALFAPALARRFGLENMMVGMTLLLGISVFGRVWFGAGALFFGTLMLSFAIGMLNALTAPFIKKYAETYIALATGVFSLSMSVLAGFGAWVVVPMAAAITWQWAMSGWAVFCLIAASIWLYIAYTYRHSTTAIITNSKSTFSPWRSLDAWLMAVLIGLQSFLFYIVASFLPSIAIAQGLSTEQATLFALIFQLMAPPAIIILTWLIKRHFSTRLVGLIGSIFNAVGVFGMLYLPQWLGVWSALMGFGCAAVFTLSLMMFSLRTKNSDHARDLSGMVQAVGYFLALFGPLSAGFLFEKTGDWDLALMVILALMLVNVPVGYFASSRHLVDYRH